MKIILWNKNLLTKFQRLIYIGQKYNNTKPINILLLPGRSYLKSSRQFQILLSWFCLSKESWQEISATTIHTKPIPLGLDWTSRVVCTFPTGKAEKGQEIQWDLLWEFKTKATQMTKRQNLVMTNFIICDSWYPIPRCCLSYTILIRKMT